MAVTKLQRPQNLESQPAAVAAVMCTGVGRGLSMAGMEWQARIASTSTGACNALGCSYFD